MGILVEDKEEKSLLERRITADLRERRMENSKQEGDDPDSDDFAMLEGTKKTGRFSWFWAILIVLAILSLLVIFVIK